MITTYNFKVIKISQFGLILKFIFKNQPIRAFEGYKKYIKIIYILFIYFYILFISFIYFLYPRYIKVYKFYILMNIPLSFRLTRTELSFFRIAIRKSVKFNLCELWWWLVSEVKICNLLNVIWYVQLRIKNWFHEIFSSDAHR